MACSHIFIPNGERSGNLNDFITEFYQSPDSPECFQRLSPAKNDFYKLYK